MICIISDFSYPILGGTEKHVFELASYLTKKNKVLIISPVWGSEKKEYNFNNLKIKKFKLPGRRTIIRTAYYFYQLLKNNNKITSVNAHYLLPGVAATIYARLMNKKAYVTIHDYENINRKFPNNLMVKVLNKSDRVIATTNFLKEKMIENGIKKEKITVIPNWTKNTNVATTKASKGKPIILFVGRVIKNKGVHVLIKSIKHVKKDAKYYFIGKEMSDEFRKLAKQEGVYNKCVFKGFVSEKELEGLYKNCTTLVLPSIKLEGFGLVMIEAMKYGKPVIGSKQGGIPEAMGGGGIIFKTGSEKELSKAINKILSDKDLYKKLSIKAKKRAIELDMNKVLKEYEELITK